jgi:hypothetical protein
MKGRKNWSKARRVLHSHCDWMIDFGTEIEKDDKWCVSWRKWCGDIELTDTSLYNTYVSGSVVEHQGENVQDLSRCRFRSEIAGYASPDVYLRWSPILIKMICQLGTCICYCSTVLIIRTQSDVVVFWWSGDRNENGKKNLPVSSLWEIRNIKERFHDHRW